MKRLSFQELENIKEKDLIFLISNKQVRGHNDYYTDEYIAKCFLVKEIFEILEDELGKYIRINIIDVLSLKEEEYIFYDKLAEWFILRHE